MIGLRRWSLFFVVFIGYNINLGIHGNSNTIPRSTSRGSGQSASPSVSSNDDDDDDDDALPWNPSKQINPDTGFLTSLYPLCPGEWEGEARLLGRHAGPASRRSLHTQFVRIRQVPGDGNCLFHSITTCMGYVVNGTHSRDLHELRRSSRDLRTRAVHCLSDRPRRTLFLQGEECLRARDLVEAAAGQYNMTGERYCEYMRRESYWGGGPEIVALCNVLRRPIHVYELTEDHGADYYHEQQQQHTQQHPPPSPHTHHGHEERPKNDRAGAGSPTPHTGFRLRRMACFGSPKFDRREPLRILSADSRFPDVTPGRQLASGNHFLSLFPVKENEDHNGDGTMSATTKMRGARSSSSSLHSNIKRNKSKGQRKNKHTERAPPPPRNTSWMNRMSDKVFGHRE